MKIGIILFLLMLVTSYGRPESTTRVVYRQLIDSCSITKIDLPLVKNVTVCDVKIGCPICNEVAKFELIGSESKTNLSEITGFRVKNCEVFYLPQFHQISQNLKFLSVTSSGLRKITQDNLRDLINLESLDLGGNKIQTLEEGTFKYNLKIKAIHLISNPITFVASRTFDVLEHFVLLDFRSIICYSGTINETNLTKMSQALIMLTNSCNSWTPETPTKPENCNKSIQLESSDYVDESAASTSSTSSNMIHACTHSVFHYCTTEIKVFLIIQTSVIAALFVIIFAMIYQIKSSKVETLYRGSINRTLKPKDNLWMSKSKSLHSINNDSYDHLTVNSNLKTKPTDYEDVLPAAMNNGNVNYEDGDNKVEVEEELYSDIQDKTDNKSEAFNLYAIPKKQ